MPKDRMLNPEMVSEFVAAFAEECAEQRRETAGVQTDLIKPKSAVEQSLRGILKAIEAGAWNETLRKRLTELECRKAEIEGELSASSVPAPVALHPDTAGLYAAKVGELADSLTDPAVRVEAAEAIRTLIERVVLTPDPDAPNGLAAELQGDVALILGFAGDAGLANRRPAHGRRQSEKLPMALADTGAMGRQLWMVAGTGFEPVTFRL